MPSGFQPRAGCRHCRSSDLSEVNASGFIARNMHYKGKTAVWAIAVSFLVIIVSVSIAGGFRREIRNGVSEIAGDVQITDTYQNYYSDSAPVRFTSDFIAKVESIDGVRSVVPSVYRAGIVRTEEGITGVLFKGVAMRDSTSLGVRIPSALARKLLLSVGDDMTSYFVGERVRIRKFKVTDIYESLIDNDENLIVYAGIDDLRRLNLWEEEEASVLEVSLDESYRSRYWMNEKAVEIGAVSYPLIATSAVNRYGHMFDWLDLIDFNVLAILALMILVAAFNMISGLLIMLFRNISTIGTLKAMGMDDVSISKVFLRISSGVVLKGMLIGNVISLVLCAVQSVTHIIKLNPANYFVSFVPVQVNPLQIILADVIAYGVIMLLLLIPSLFISKVDPAQTVRVK